MDENAKNLELIDDTDHMTTGSALLPLHCQNRENRPDVTMMVKPGVGMGAVCLAPSLLIKTWNCLLVTRTQRRSVSIA